MKLKPSIDGETGESQGKNSFIETIRLTQDFGSMSDVKKVITTIPVKKPHRQSFFRVHPGEGYRLDVAVIEDKIDNEIYVVTQDLFFQIPNEVSKRTLRLAITTSRDLFIIPLKHPGADGRLDRWGQSMILGCNQAESHWVRVQSNMSIGAYEISLSMGNLPEPVWPEESFKSLVEIAFRGYVVDTLGHSLLKRLRGEMC